MPESDFSESPLERARRRLYTPGADMKAKETGFAHHMPGAPEHWKPEAQVLEKPRRPRMAGTTLFLIGAVSFFVLAGIATATVLFLGGRSVSADNVDIIIEGPTTIEGGETVSLLVTVKNDNPVAIAGAMLAIDFPEGAFASTNQTEPLGHVTEVLGDIEAGASVRKTFRATFFGAENQKIVVPLSVEYTTGNSNAVFVKKNDYELVLGTPPVSLVVTTLTEAASGQPFTTSVVVRSNAATPLENVAVQMKNLPFGYQVTATTPEPVGENLFAIGRLMPGEEKEVRITGLLSGEDGDERVFTFDVGTLGIEEPPTLDVFYTRQTALVRIAKPFLAVNLTLDRSLESSMVVPSGATVQGNVSWVNTLATSLTDGSIAVTLSGSAFDPASVSVVGGFYRSSDRTIVFNRERTPTLARLEPGDTGSGTFSFSTKTGSALAALRNPVMMLEVAVSGRRVGDNKVPETIRSTLTRNIKVATDLRLGTNAVRTIGPFTNTGPWPPKADEESTYTIQLTATNTVNSIAGALARMTLPSYVRFTGKVSDGSTVNYSETTREVTWTVGDLGPGNTRQAAFQVALLPSTAQRGTSPVLVFEQAISGFDRFVQQQVGGTAPALTTQITADPQYSINSAAVQ